MKKLCNLLFVLLTLCVFSQDANADVGLPMIVVLEPLFIFLFLPIVLIEAWVFKCHLPDATYKDLLKANFWSNLSSTALGIPLAWLGCVLVEVVLVFFVPLRSSPGFWEYAVEIFLRAPWLELERPSYWTAPVATMVLLVPCFFMSVWVESRSITNTLQGYAPDQLKVITRKANIASYALLYTIVAVFLIYNLWKH